MNVQPGILCDHQLHDQHRETFQMEPWMPERVQPCSIDIHLDRFFLTMPTCNPMLRPSEIDPWQPVPMVEWNVPKGECFLLPAGGFALGSTYECVTLTHHIAARLEGKSSLGRIGLMVHSTAGWIDPGFRGTVTLELSNLSPLPIRLWPGMAIGQICFFRLSRSCRVPYGSEHLGSHYQDQPRGPRPSASHQRFYCVDLP